MIYTTIKKWAFRIVFILNTAGIIVYWALQTEINQHRGSNTQVVNSHFIKTQSSPLAITNVSVLSTDCSKMIDGMTVLIEDGKILEIAKHLSLPNHYQKIDGSGKYLIPGLIDTHVHLNNSKNDLLLYLTNGVTSIAEMSGNERHLRWRKEAQQGALSPHLFVATRELSSTKGMIPAVRSWVGNEKIYTTVASARQAIRQYKVQGYDAIKLSPFLNATIYRAMVREAQKQEIPVIGLNRFHTSGKAQLTHVEGIVKKTIEDFGGLHDQKAKAYLRYLKQRSNMVASQLRKQNITVSSTLWLAESFPKQKFDLENFIKTIALEYANPGVVEGSRLVKGWLPGYNDYENLSIRNNPVKSKKSRVYWSAYVKAHQIMTKALIRNGVKMIAGTNANTACVVPGFSLHDELESLHKAGLSNAQVLRATTIQAAQWMQNGSTGQIEEGYIADLVLLAKNPLVDIKNTKTIQAVITKGKYLDRKNLDKMLQSVKKANRQSRKENIDAYIQ